MQGEGQQATSSLLQDLLSPEVENQKVKTPAPHAVLQKMHHRNTESLLQNHDKGSSQRWGKWVCLTFGVLSCRMVQRVKH